MADQDQNQNPPAAGTPSKTTKARVLVATTIEGKSYKPNDLAEVPSDQVKALAGVVDAHPNAVKHAEAIAAAAARKRAADAGDKALEG